MTNRRSKQPEFAAPIAPERVKQIPKVETGDPEGIRTPARIPYAAPLLGALTDACARCLSQTRRADAVLDRWAS